MSARAFAWPALGVLAFAACLANFAPPIGARNPRPGDPHTGVRAGDDWSRCSACHVAADAAGAAAMEDPSAAAPVAAWMIDDARGCTDCHRVRGGAR